MNLKYLKDSELLSQTKALVQSERLLLTKVLHHLREVERRRLFSDLGYQSLFEYAVKELKYSEGQAGRRIQAMRLLKELPEIEDKITSGALSLSNISQAQSYFRSVQKKSANQQISINLNSTEVSSSLNKESSALDIGTSSLNKDSTASQSSISNSKNCLIEEGKCQFDESSTFTQSEGLLHPIHSSQGSQSSTLVITADAIDYKEENNHQGGLIDEPINKSEKLRLLESLENKSAREGQKLILSIQPEALPPKERERVLSEDKTEIKFVITAELKAKLVELRALLGTKGATMSFSDLISYMADISIQETQIKKFGKKRVLDATPTSELLRSNDQSSYQSITVSSRTSKAKVSQAEAISRLNSSATPTLESRRIKKSGLSNNPRYISQSLRFEVWMRDGGQCTKCGSRRHLNFDHIKPLAIGGETSLSNLRLLCFHCNQRQAYKILGESTATSYEINNLRSL